MNRHYSFPYILLLLLLLLFYIKIFYKPIYSNIFQYIIFQKKKYLDGINKKFETCAS